MTEYSRMAKGNYTVSGGTLGVSGPNVKIIALPFKPDFVTLVNLTQSATPANHGVVEAVWDATASITSASVVYDTVIKRFNSTPVLTTDIVQQGLGIYTFSNGLTSQFAATVH